MRKGTQGEGLVFYGPEEATIAYNEKKVDIHAPIKVYVNDIDKEGYPESANILLPKASPIQQ